MVVWLIWRMLATVGLVTWFIDVSAVVSGVTQFLLVVATINTLGVIWRVLVPAGIDADPARFFHGRPAERARVR